VLNRTTQSFEPAARTQSVGDKGALKDTKRQGAEPLYSLPPDLFSMHVTPLQIAIKMGVSEEFATGDPDPSSLLIPSAPQLSTPLLFEKSLSCEVSGLSDRISEPFFH
jgi:hypothetical protein